MNTRTKIVATLGPASWDEPMLSRLLEAGVDVFRINCSHAGHEGVRKQVARVRRAAAQADQPTAILLDLQGPKIRTGAVPTPLQLPAGSVLTVVMDPDYTGEGTRVGTTYPQMAGDVRPGDVVLFADGALAGAVVAVRAGAPAEVDIRIDQGGELGSHKGINLPGVAMSVPSLTDKDRADLALGVELGVDYVALSFVQGAEDVRQLRDELARLGKPETPIVAKIEKPRAVESLDEILDVADGVMVARGDLGVEVPIEAVPVYQKRILEATFRRGKLGITATQMLDSMERNPRPTRAETTDVANAILDGTDAVMLSGETAVGRYPVEAVRTMDRIARLAESSKFFRLRPDAVLDRSDPRRAVIHAACTIARELEYPLVVYTWSGEAALLASKYRPPAGIHALSPDPAVVDRLALVWGVLPVYVPPVRSTDDLLQAGEAVLVEKGLLARGDGVVVVAGRTPVRGATHLLKVYKLGES
jgi:pyruvate kinase